jgi:hypothetical protein
VLAKKSAFTPNEESAVQQYVQQHSPLQVLYSPSQAGSNVFSELIRSNDPAAFSRTYQFNVSPVSDNKPFFFFTLKTRDLLHSVEDSGAIDWKVNLGIAVLGMLLLISVAAVLLFLLIPLLIGERSGHHHSSPFYFVAVGLGYILVEVSFIQRFVLFLGHPTYALTVVVFLMLLSSGMGSFASRRWLSDANRVWVPLAAIVTVLLVYAVVLPILLNAYVGVAFGLKLVISAALLVPLGFTMGMPFPTGLRAIAGTGENISAGGSVEWAWALNAAASVLGSVLAIVIAMEFGLTTTLVCGALAYGFGTLLRPRVSGQIRSA